MVSEAIGRFFPDQIAWSRDSKMWKTRQESRDISISNTQNEKVEVFDDQVPRTYVWPNFDAWKISRPSYSFLKNWSKDSLATDNIKENWPLEFKNNRSISRTYVFPISEESFWIMIRWRHRYDSSALTSEKYNSDPAVISQGKRTDATCIISSKSPIWEKVRNKPKILIYLRYP